MWTKRDVCAASREEDVGIMSEGEQSRHYSNLCPEVSYRAFGLFASDLYRFKDDIDMREAHRSLREEKAPLDDWRWNWIHIEPMHFTDCSYYSMLQ